MLNVLTLLDVTELQMLIMSASSPPPVYISPPMEMQACSFVPQIETMLGHETLPKRHSISVLGLFFLFFLNVTLYRVINGHCGGLI